MLAAVHNEPHPLALKYVKPNNQAIAKKFGVVRIEDWDDRVAGLPWTEQIERHNFPQAEQYRSRAQYEAHKAPLGSLEVVRCHTQSTGELVLLHHDWVKDGEVIA